MERFSTVTTIHNGDDGGTTDMEKVNGFIDFIRELNELLHTEDDLSPANHQVTQMIGRLSQQLRTYYSPEEIKAVLSHEYMAMNQRVLQDKLSEAEFQVELADSRAICDAEGPVLDNITRLPYWTIYMALVGEELSMLRQLIREDGQSENTPIVFVGSGPMPLSPIIMHLFGDVEVICLDIDPAACEVSSSFLAKMGLEDKVKVVMENGCAFDYSAYSRIFVASLVRNKQAVLERISCTSSEPLVAVRTAVGMKQIMYEAIDESQLSEQRWRIVGRTCPEDGVVINSTLFLERIS
ncbi:nicotianamine synthase family protein [Paenibacillus sinopodophylli]|uniref:nicotianamine synthase family protein n=1 Tax=Paenibacillus sinopodophylli TaxID=1837342 RepID=UPI00110CB4B1|nr:nicotianamine synthase family protein [Paenibacillus sinopodophylli]